MIDATFLNRVIDKWDNMTHTVLDLKEFSLSDMQGLLTDTYGILNEYHKEALVPKEASKLLLNMDEFLYFASLMEEKEKTLDFYHYQAIYTIIRALKEGFFKSNYEPAYPLLKIIGLSNEELIFDLKNDSLENFLKR